MTPQENYKEVTGPSPAGYCGRSLKNARVQLNRKVPTPPSRFRQHWMLAPGTVFLNHGSFGACPEPILELQAELRCQMEAEPVQFLWRRYEERLEPSRRVLAKFVGAQPRDLVFTTNATTGINAIMQSLKWRRSDEVLTTNHDYNACHNVLVEATRRAGAKLVVAQVPFPLRSPDEVIEAILRRVTRRTRLAMVDHVTSNTGLVFPVDRIVLELEARGIATLIDGAHAPGMLSLNLQSLRPSYYTGNLHKWVCAPKGAAFLWVREDLQAQVQPAVISHGNNTPRPDYRPFQDRFDWPGTFDPSAWFCIGAAIDWMGQLFPGGWAEMQKANHELVVTARQILCRTCQVAAPCPETMLGAMATIPLPRPFQGRPRTGKIDVEQLRLYDEYGIEVPFVRVGRPERRYFRISAQVYNSAAEYEYLAEKLRWLQEELA
jgi:isopenicillin-N epimerase